MYSVDNLVPYDLEVSPNYFLTGFRLPDGTVYQYRFTDTDLSNIDGLRQFINYIEQSDYTLVGFNSNSYDDVVLSEFLANPATTTAYRTSLRIIEEKAPPWDFIQDVSSVDLIRILPNSMSLKKIGVCLGHHKLQELPINPHENLNPEQMRIVDKYNINDLEITHKLAEAIYNELVLRRDLSLEYRVDLRSKGEATIAELILTNHITQQTGLKKNELKNIARENILRNPAFNIKVPSWWEHLPGDRYPSLEAVIQKGDTLFTRRIHVSDYKLEEGALSDTLFIGDRWYQMGIGGLHSIDGSGCWTPRPGQVCMDVDVTSYYPALMLTQGLSPRHWIINGVDHFRSVFEHIVNTRVAAKREGDKNKADRLKITINGTFGKTNDQYSSLYDPYIMASVTVSGQLALLTLVAMVTDCGITVISANTDGITLLYDGEHDETLRKVVSEWEQLTQLGMEYCQYDAFYQKDVNNYIAIPTDKPEEPKTKGVFNIPKLGGIDLRHTPNAQIVSRAVIEKVVHNRDITLTVTDCRDVQEFLLTQQVRGDWEVTWRDEPLGKMVRFYKAHNGSPVLRTPLHSGVKGNAGIVANSESAVPLPDLPESFDSIVDLNHDWYIKQATALYETITHVKRPYLNAVAWALHQEGMMPTIITHGKNDRKSTKVGDHDFTSMRDTERFAVCTGRHYGVLGKRLRNGKTRFYKVNEKYPSKTRTTIMKNEGFELVFGCNLEVDPYDQLYRVDETYLEQFYTETEMRKVRCQTPPF